MHGAIGNLIAMCDIVLRIKKNFRFDKSMANSVNDLIPLKIILQ